MCEYKVYVHTNLINGKVYIGMTKNTETRWKSKGIHYKPKTGKNNRPFWNAIVKYGWDNFKHEILVDNLSYEDACECEKYLIWLSRARDKRYGYNVSVGGNGGIIYKEHPRGMKGKTHTEEYKRVLSLRMSGENNYFYGRKWTNETHPRGMKGKTHTEESKRKTSETLKAKQKDTIEVIFCNGEVMRFKSKTHIKNELGLSYDLVTKIINSCQPYTISNCVNKSIIHKLKPYEGVIIKYIDNTEVNQEIKES